jgi:hypothetical protein
VAAPALAPLTVVGLALTPLGCATRGLLALTVVGLSLLAALCLAIRGLVARLRGREVSSWWLASAAILILPALLVLGPLR